MPNPNRKNVLVVDDSALVRKFSRKWLEELGFIVDEAADGKEALAKCAAVPFALVLLDWNMPVMDGMQFLISFRAHTPQEQCRVVFCTTETEHGKINMALTSGADDYIMKPFDKEILATKLTGLGLLGGN